MSEVSGGREDRELVDHAARRSGARRRGAGEAGRRSRDRTRRRPTHRARDVGCDRGGDAALGLTTRPSDMGTLQAIAAVGQPRLLERMNGLLGAHDVVVGQVLLTPYDFVHRSQYLHARETLAHLLDLGVLPIVNENDTVADDEIRYGDNDRLAALVSHLLGADVLLMLTDTAGVFTADPRRDADASLIEEIVEVDAALEVGRGRRGHRSGERGDGEQARGGQDRGVVGRAPRVIASAKATCSRRRRAREATRFGTSFTPRAQRLPSRKLWIAFARPKVRSSSTRALGARSSSAESRCCSPACAASRASSTPTPRSRSSTRPVRSSRRACAGTRRRCCGPRGRQTAGVARRASARGRAPRRPRRAGELPIRLRQS